jgi:hypothetical protein
MGDGMQAKPESAVLAATVCSVEVPFIIDFCKYHLTEVFLHGFHRRQWRRQGNGDEQAADWHRFFSGRQEMGCFQFWAFMIWQRIVLFLTVPLRGLATI